MSPWEEEPFHHFPLLSQPNCRGDVIFPTDRECGPDWFCNAKLHQIPQNSKTKVCNFISHFGFRHKPAMFVTRLLLLAVCRGLVLIIVSWLPADDGS